MHDGVRGRPEARIKRPSFCICSCAGMAEFRDFEIARVPKKASNQYVSCLVRAKLWAFPKTTSPKILI